MKPILSSLKLSDLLAQAHGASSDLIQRFDWTEPELVASALIVGLPLVSSLLIFLTGKTMWRGGGAVAIAAVAGSLLASLYLFYNHIVGHAEVADYSGAWFHVGDYAFTVGFLLDNLAVWLATLVSLLSLLIIVFSTSYLADEPDGKLRRYYAVKALFVAGMLGTVLMDNYLLMFIFWEIMGLCSYLLIGYWYHKESAAIAAKKAFLVTRLGDIFLFLGIVLLFTTFHTLSYRELFHHPDLMANKDTLFWAGLFIFGGAVGKSAQFPLDLWLPDAMEGPTTVSALIHAATMVKAGVYLVARSFPLLLINPELFLVVGIIGGITAIYTATMALTALDIKRVLAFSTLSQLGYMFLALGAGGFLYSLGQGGAGFTAAMLHLMNHAFFKALLFLGSASVILGMHHHQDLREMGGLKDKMPKTYWTMLIGSLSIAGIIPLSGFWSKDEVLSTAFKAGSYNSVFFLLWLFGILTAALTAFYMFRMVSLAFWGKPRTEMAEHAHESPSPMTVPLVVLAVFAAVSGLWLVLGPGFESVITYPYSHDLGEHEAASSTSILMHILLSPLTYLSLAVAAGGIWFAVRKYRAGLPESERAEPTKGVRGLLYNRYYVTQAIYEPLGNSVAFGIAKLSSWFDRKGIDGAVNGVASAADHAGARTRRWQDGRLTTYMASIAIGAAILLVFLREVVLRIRW
ncbi:MAG TPA: NADH-quinone oxidoreductase subunit L [Candidatus Thermoplasmatota archaeon]|nr:NADH-quinone oxidoreductase subunit L [Candidatus Thermoplasmatota archaeon]